MKLPGLATPRGASLSKQTTSNKNLAAAPSTNELTYPFGDEIKELNNLPNQLEETETSVQFVIISLAMALDLKPK
jgi:hypothetical protein